MKKLFLLVVLSIFVHQVSSAQTEKEQLGVAIKQILTGFKTQNADKINAFVDKKYGIGVVFLSDDFTTAGYLNLEEMDFSFYFPNHKSYWEISKPPKLKFEKAPEFSLHNQNWSKYGLFCEQNSKIIKQYLDWFNEQGSDLSDQSIFKINANSKNVARVTFADIDSNGLEFVLTKIDHRWVLTFIDLTSIQAE